MSSITTTTRTITTTTNVRAKALCDAEAALCGMATRYTSTVWDGTAEVRPTRSGGIVVMRSWCPVPETAQDLRAAARILGQTISVLRGDATLPGETHAEAAMRTERR